MPSIRSILAGLALASISLVQIASAAPVARPECDDPALPTIGAGTEFPASNFTLKYVAIGRGVQNYSCTAVGATPVLIGAVANLYDATKLAHTSLKSLHALPAKALAKANPSTTNKGDFLSLPYLGFHFFDRPGTPIFTLTSARSAPKPIVYVAKVLGIPAPVTAAKTAVGVDWLSLKEKTVTPYTGLTVGVKEVYRVVTAGGLAGSCDVVGVKVVQYATEYWYYN